MRRVTEDEFNSAKKTIGDFVKPLIREIDEQFCSDESLKILQIEPEDFPESERHRFDSSSTLQTLAGLFRQRHSPLNCWYISVRNGGLYAVRGKRPRNANAIKSNQ